MIFVTPVFLFAPIFLGLVMEQKGLCLSGGVRGDVGNASSSLAFLSLGFENLFARARKT